jgi:hypothetical protein
LVALVALISIESHGKKNIYSYIYNVYESIDFNATNATKFPERLYLCGEQAGSINFYCYLNATYLFTIHYPPSPIPFFRGMGDGVLGIGDGEWGMGVGRVLVGLR